MIKKHSLFLWILIASALGCNSSLEDPVDAASYGYDYYPLIVGQYRIYQVDSMQFDIGTGDLPVRDSATFYLREEVKEVWQDPTGGDLYRIERYRSDHPDGPWEIWDVVTRSRTTNQGYYTENNIRLINLIFPLTPGIRWNGTSFIDDRILVLVRGESIEMYKDWDFEVLEVGSKESIGDLSFPEVATIRQVDSENIIEKRYSLEKYAKGVGLVFREREIVDSYCKYQGINDSCIGKNWIEKAGRGFFSRETLIAHN